MADLTVSSDVDSFMAAANAAAMRTVLGLGPIATQASSAVAITGGTLAGLTGLAIRSTGAAFDLAFASSEVLTAGRTLSFNVGDANRTLTIPATGTAALLGTANVFTAVNEFQDRIQLTSSTAYKNILQITYGGFNYLLLNYENIGLRLPNNRPIGFTSGSAELSVDLQLGRASAATLQLGADAAGVTNQMFTAASRITSDGVGANLTIAAGNGRGGAGGSLILSYYTTAAAATIGTLTEAMRINTLGQIVLNNLPTSDPGVVGALYRTAGAVMISV